MPNRLFLISLFSILYSLDLQAQNWESKVRECSLYLQDKTLLDCPLNWVEVEFEILPRFVTSQYMKFYMRWWPKDTSAYSLSGRVVNIRLDLEFRYANGRTERIQSHLYRQQLDYRKKFLEAEYEFRYSTQELWNVAGAPPMSPTDLFNRVFSNDLSEVVLTDVFLEDFPAPKEASETMGNGLIEFPCVEPCSSFVDDRGYSYDKKTEFLEFSTQWGRMSMKLFQPPGPTMDAIYENDVLGEKYKNSDLVRRVDHVSNGWPAVTWIICRNAWNNCQVVRAYQLPGNKGILVFHFSDNTGAPEEKLFRYENIFLSKLKLLK